MLRVFFQFLLLVTLLSPHLSQVYADLSVEEYPEKVTLQPDNQEARSIEISDTSLTPLVQTLRYYDEVLTQSIRSYTYSKNPKWLKRYREHRLKLDQTIEAINATYYSPDTIEFRRFQQTNNTLYLIEDEIIVLVDENKSDEAIKVLEGEEYNNEKAAYNRALNVYLGLYNQQKKPAINLSEEEQAWLQKHPEIIIAFDGDYAPYSYINEKGEFKGIAVDFAREMAHRAGIKLQFYPDGKWKTVYKAGESREVDVIATIVKRPERQKWFKFTEPYISLAQYIITRKADSSINNRDQIFGKKVALVESYSTTQSILEDYPTVIPFYVDSLSEALEAVATGQVDATVAAMGMAQQLASQKGITTLKFAALYAQGLSDQRFGVRKDWPELASILDKALASLSDNERLRIFQRWSRPEVAQVETIIPPWHTTHLNDSERKWLSEHPIIRVQNETNWAPFNFNEKGQVKGYSIDYMNLLAEKLGIKVEYVSGPSWGEFLGMIKAKELDVMLNIVITENRRNYINFTDDYLRTLTGIYVHRNAPAIESLEELKGKTVAIPKGFFEQELIERYYPQIKMHLTNDNLEALEAVLIGKADAALGETAVMSHLQLEHSISDLILSGTIADKRFDNVLNIGVRKDWPILRDILQKAKDSIPFKEKKQLKEKWLAQLGAKEKPQIKPNKEEQAWLAKHPSIRLGFNQDMQPLLIQDAEGDISGIIPEIFTQLEELTGLKIKIEVAPWPTAISRAREGETDGLALCGPALADAAGLVSTRGYIPTFPVVFGQNDALFKINSLNDLKGKRVAYMKNVKYLENILASYGSEISAIQTDTFFTALTMVIEGKADVVLGRNFDTYMMHQNVLTGIEPLYIDTTQLIEAVIAIRPDWPELTGILNKGLDTLGVASITQIISKWTQLEVPKEKIALNAEEKTWIKEHPQISIAYDGNLPPYSYYSSSGEMVGVAVDVVNLLSERLNITFQVYPESTWNELYEAAQNREVDVVATMVERPARQEWFAFTRPYINITTALFVRDSYTLIKNINDLPGKRIALIKSYASSNEILEMFPDMEPVYVDDVLDAFSSVSSGESDVALASIGEFSHYIRKQGITNLRMAAIYSHKSSNQSFGVRNDWPLLASILDKGLASISEQEMMRIRSDWISIKRPAETLEIDLSVEQKAWLKSHPSIRLGFTPHLEPLLIKQEDGSLEGIYPTIFDELEQILDVSINIEVDDWNSIVQKARDRELDGLLACAPSQAEASNLQRTRPIQFVYPVAFTHHDSPFTISNLNDLKGKRIAYQREIKMLEVVLNQYQDNSEIIAVNSTLEALALLLEGKADVVFGISFESYLLEKHALTGIKIAHFDLEHENAIAPCVRDDWPELVGILNKGLDHIGLARIQETLTQWTGSTIGRQVLELTIEERAWLAEHPIISVGADQYWEPVEFVDRNGIFQGISVDYLKIIETMIGVSFEFDHAPWQQLIKRIQDRELDMLSSVAKTPKREQYLLFTDPYIDMPIGIFTDQNVSYIGNLSELSGKRVAVVNGYAIHEFLTANYPDIATIPVTDIEEGFRKLTRGEVYAYIDNMLTTGHKIRQKGYTQIRMVGEIPYRNFQSMGVNSELPILRDILQKALENISHEERNAIYQKWISVTYEQGIDYSLIWKIVGGAVCVIVLFVLWNRSLKVEVRKKTSELRSREEQYRLLAENSADVIWTMDAAQNLNYISPSILQLRGYTPEEAMAEPFEEWVVRSSLEKVHEHIAKATQSNDPVYFEAELPCKNGSTVWVEMSVRNMLDDSGNRIGMIGTSRDITERKQALEKLQVSERNYRKMFNSANDAIVILDISSGKFVDCNLKTLEMFKGTTEDILGKSPWELSPLKQVDGTDSRTKSQEVISSVHSKGSMTSEWQHMRLDGEVFDTEISMSTIEIDSKPFLQAIVRDTSERKRLDNEIRLLQLWVENSDDLFFWVRGDSQILYVNKAVCSLLEYSHDELRTMKVGDFDLEITFETWPDFVAKLRDHGSLCFETQLCKKSGEIVPVEITANLVNFDGKDHFFSYGRDISARISAEKDRQELEKQLNQAQKMEAIGTLAGGIAHDFNNILSAIFGYTELAKEDADNSEALSNNLDAVLNGALRAKDLVKQILTFSRRSEQELQPLKVQLVIKEALKLLRSSIPATIEFKEDINQECEAVLADPTQIHQIIMNLCTNAYHAMRQSGGTLAVSLQPYVFTSETLGSKINLHPGSYLKLEISDTGCGISKINQEKIFEPYFTTKEKGEGTGLGLAVVHGIVRSIGGEITVYSEPDTGTSFQIYLPVIKDTKTIVQEQDTAPVPTGDEKILLVDDDEALVQVHKKILETLGYTATALESSTDALEMFKKAPNDFDLVITDLTMPNLTGIDLTKAMLAIRPDLPVILCTGFSEMINAEKAKEIGIRDYVMKPILKKELARIVRKTIDASDTGDFT